MTIARSIFSVLVALLFTSCGRSDYVKEKPSLDSLCGVWRLHSVNESLKSRVGDELWANRSAVTIYLQRDGTAVLSAVPAFKGNERNAFTLISGTAKWRLVPLERVGGGLLWQVLLIAKNEGIGIPLVLKRSADRYVLDYMADEDAPTGIQFILESAPEQKKRK